MKKYTKAELSKMSKAELIKIASTIEQGESAKNNYMAIGYGDIQIRDATMEKCLKYLTKNVNSTSLENYYIVEVARQIDVTYQPYEVQVA